LQAAITLSNDRIVPLAHHMADASGDIIRKFYRSAGLIDRKGDASPVTRADKEAETAMRALIEAHFPDHGIVGEEFGNVRSQSDFQWVLDPIDGTRNFIGGYPIFTTLIALLYKGEPIVGIINQPVLQERWIGMQNEASALNFKTISTRDCRDLASAVVATTSTDYFTQGQAASFAKLRKECTSCILGGDAYAYAMLASGNIDIVVDGGMKPYDFCALKPVIEGAGGIITDWQGKPLGLASDGTVLAAATKELHTQALALIAV